MKTNIRTAKSKLYTDATIYYVSSRSGGDEHIVVSNKVGAFCDCKDFMTRRLPLLGTSGYTDCRHIEQVLEISNGTFPAKPVESKYGIFIKETNGQLRQCSGAMSVISSNPVELQNMVKEHLNSCQDCPYDRRVFKIVNGRPAVQVFPVKIKKKYGIFIADELLKGHRSEDLPKTYTNRKQAETDLRKFQVNGTIREIREL